MYVFLNNPLSWRSFNFQVSSCCPHLPCRILENLTEQLQPTAPAFGDRPYAGVECICHRGYRALHPLCGDTWD